MLALIQRVTRAHVEVGGEVVGAVDAGLLVLICAEPPDGDEQAGRLVSRLLKLRIFADETGKMNRSIQDVSGGLLLVPQFTLAASTAGGNRPSFSGAAPPELGRRLFDEVVAVARTRHSPVAAGVFGAHMQVHLINDGPVTIPMQIGPT